MPEKVLIPSIDMRLGALLELSRRKEQESEGGAKLKPTITISREFGCEAYSVAERLKELLDKKTGENWVIMDKALLEEVASNHQLSEDILKGLGEKLRFFDEIQATFSNRWKSEKDHYRLLCRHIASLAGKGNVIIVGRGSSIVTQAMNNCTHFRIFGSPEFKIRSIARRLSISSEEAGKVISKKQHQRDAFIRDFLDKDAHDLSFYHVVFNNDKNTADQIARMIMNYVPTN